MIATNGRTCWSHHHRVSRSNSLRVLGYLCDLGGRLRGSDTPDTVYTRVQEYRTPSTKPGLDLPDFLFSKKAFSKVFESRASGLTLKEPPPVRSFARGRSPTVI